MAPRVLPAVAAWRHAGARDGFEVVFLRSDCRRFRADGVTTAVENGDAWVVRYDIELAPDGATRTARVVGRSAAGTRELGLQTDGAGRWRINGARARELDGCLDVDLESSALTNAFPVRRLRLEVGRHAEAPAAYVRALDLGVERLEQRYMRLDDEGKRSRYAYSAPAFRFACELLYDEYGLVLDYPGIGTRVT